MKNIAIIVLLVVAAALGYWFGGQQKKIGAGDTAPAATAAPSGKKILYYRNPMGLPDTSPTPKKDAMGMDYIPVYEGEEEEADGGVKISTAKVQKLGVRSEAAAMRELSRPIRAVGRVEIDERRVFAIAPKFEGWIERLYVNTTGQPVGKGQALFEVYSPELVSAQREYQVAAHGAQRLVDDAQGGLLQLAEAALARLANWDVPREEIERLKAGGAPTRTLFFRSPVAGVVLEKKALPGMRFMPGETLYQIADIGTLWVLADVFEHDIAAVKIGMPVTVTLDAWPEREFTGKVSFISPTLDAATRTVPVRIELSNPGGLLRPGMYAKVELKVGAGGTALTVPVSAIIDSGIAQRVIVQKEEGRFEPREVKLGARNDDFVEVKAGVQEGERVVVAANFLIDSESNLKAALGGMQEAKPSVSHRAAGTLEGIGADGTVMISHEPVASLGWPRMTMGFLLANSALVDKIQPGTPIAFEFVERKPGEWVITKLERR